MTHERIVTTRVCSVVGGRKLFRRPVIWRIAGDAHDLWARIGLGWRSPACLVLLQRLRYTNNDVVLLYYLCALRRGSIALHNCTYQAIPCRPDASRATLPIAGYSLHSRPLAA
ncbi:MAG: hypothetical protein ACRDHW_24375 [Ktedonobacteraceae bacterium]